MQLALEVWLSWHSWIQCTKGSCFLNVKFLLDIFFIYISNAIPFPSFLFESPLYPPPTHSHFLALAFPCTGVYNLHKTKGLSSHWWTTRPSSAMYATRDTSSGGMEGRTIQRLPHPGIHPIYNHQTQTLLHMPARFCWQDPDIAISCEAMPMPGK